MVSICLDRRTEEQKNFLGDKSSKKTPIPFCSSVLMSKNSVWLSKISVCLSENSTSDSRIKKKTPTYGLVRWRFLFYAQNFLSKQFAQGMFYAGYWNEFDVVLLRVDGLHVSLGQEEAAEA